MKWYINDEENQIPPERSFAMNDVSSIIHTPLSSEFIYCAGEDYKDRLFTARAEIQVMGNKYIFL